MIELLSEAHLQMQAEHGVLKSLEDKDRLAELGTLSKLSNQHLKDPFPSLRVGHDAGRAKYSQH